MVMNMHVFLRRNIRANENTQRRTCKPQRTPILVVCLHLLQKFKASNHIGLPVLSPRPRLPSLYASAVCNRTRLTTHPISKSDTSIIESINGTRNRTHAPTKKWGGGLERVVIGVEPSACYWDVGKNQNKRSRREEWDSGEGGDGREREEISDEQRQDFGGS